MGDTFLSCTDAYLAQFTLLTRAQIVRLKCETFAVATVNLGDTPGHILVRHLLPNAVAPVIVTGMLAIGDDIVQEAMLGFFGLGAQPPTPSWGFIMFGGSEVADLSEFAYRKLRGGRIGLITQNTTTSLDLLRKIWPRVDGVTRQHLGVDKRAAKARIVELLGDLRIPEPASMLRRRHPSCGTRAAPPRT